MLNAVSTKTGQPDNYGYGLGVQIWESDYGIIYGHGGIFPGHQTQMEYIPGLESSITIQVNADVFSKKFKKSLHEYLSVFLPLLDEHYNSE